MNKKFLSAILFGALMVSSTGTFVSCKDYDDDIDELTSRVDGVEGQIKDLEAKINAANWITSVTPATGGFTVAFNDGSSYTITNGKDGEAGAAGTEWTISEDGFWVSIRPRACFSPSYNKVKSQTKHVWLLTLL